MGAAAGGGVVRVGGEEGGVPAARGGVAIGGERRVAGGRGVAVQWESTYSNFSLNKMLIPYNGNRHTAADLLEYVDPDKITVYLRAPVHQILFTSSSSG